MTKLTKLFASGNGPGMDRDCTDFASGKHREWIGEVVKSREMDKWSKWTKQK